MNFFDRLLRLRESRPHPCIVSIGSENCAYAPYHARGKNCYLLVGHVLSEDCFYGFWVGVSRDCTDCAFTEKSEMCYECVDILECYSCNFCQDCITCSDCDFCYDCKGCQNCFGCVNLRNKQFHIFNKAYSKEEYFEKVRTLRQAQRDNGSRYDLGSPPKEFVELKNTLPHIYLQGYQNENAIGDHIFNSKNAYCCFDVSEQEDTAYIYNSHHIKDCMDLNYSSIGTEMSYMCHSGVTLFNSNFCSVCWYSQNLEYCEYVFNSHDCFGCVSRNHAEYEILNEKYPKDEYFKRVAEIKNELKRDGAYGAWWWPSQYEYVKPFSSFMA